MSSIEIKDEQLELALHQSILAALSDTARERLVDDAIKYLITNPNTSYDRESPLQKAFKSALSSISYRIAQEVFEEQGTLETVKAKFLGLLGEMPDLADDEKLQGMIFNAIMERAKEIRRSNGYA